MYILMLCDQVARLLFQYLAIFNYKILFKSFKKFSKNQEITKDFSNFAKSDNTKLLSTF